MILDLSNRITIYPLQCTVAVTFTIWNLNELHIFPLHCTGNVHEYAKRQMRFSDSNPSSLSLSVTAM